MSLIVFVHFFLFPSPPPKDNWHEFFSVGMVNNDQVYTFIFQKCTKWRPERLHNFPKDTYEVSRIETYVFFQFSVLANTVAILATTVQFCITAILFLYLTYKSWLCVCCSPLFKVIFTYSSTEIKIFCCCWINDWINQWKQSCIIPWSSDMIWNVPPYNKYLWAPAMYITTG